ncbi:MAG: ABC transporter substrate-binding protein [Pyramidobacter sp.]
MKKKILLAILSLSLLCLPSGYAAAKPKSNVTFADVGWASIKLNNALAGFVAESVFGYSWQETPGSTPISHEALMKGEIDVHMEEWTNNLPTYTRDLQAGKFTELGVNFDDNHQGFYIPKYVADQHPDLKTVKDLSRYAQLFPDPEDPSRGIIYGGVVGWEVTEIMNKKVEVYGLGESFNYFASGSDAVLSAAMTSAWDKKVPIVAYYWEPTWLLGKYEFVLLEDTPYDAARYHEGYGACPSVKVTVAVSNDFAASNPRFCDFLSRFKMSSAVISEALAYMNDTGAGYSETAQWLLSKSHPELLDLWLSAEQAAKARAAL